MRYVSILTLLGLAILTSAIGHASDRPDDAKAIKIYCPIVGLPGLKTECGCPGGYCSLKPKDKLAIDYKGAKLRFCCGECVKMFKEAPAKFAVTANHQLVATGQAKQTKCPNCGSELGYVAPVEVAGINVRFCSNICRQIVAGAKPAERFNMVFGEKAFARGFVISVDKK